MSDVPQILTNPRADRVKAVRALARPQARSKYRQFLVEGPQGVREAVRYAEDRIRDIYLTPTASQDYPGILDEATKTGAHVHLASAEVIAQMSPDAQGVLAVVRIQTAGEVRSARLLACLEQVRDPGNAGTVIRAADAAGADAVLLTSGSVDPYNPKVVRSTAGSLFHLPVRGGQDLSEAVAIARAGGLQVLAADGSAGLTLDQAPLASPTMWIFGTEARGLSDEARELADAAVRIPIHGKAESLNLAMAATVCLYASATAQREVPR
ncbi:MAG: TrmH family RNA methyltransferase [Beutenbergiaceae bacterium]